MTRINCDINLIVSLSKYQINQMRDPNHDQSLPKEGITCYKIVTTLLLLPTLVLSVRLVIFMSFTATWETPFISDQYQFFIALAMTVLVAATMYVSLDTISTRLTRNPQGCKNVLIKTFILLLLSTTMTCVFHYNTPAIIFKPCTYFSDYENNYLKAKSIFCNSCQCYLYRVEKGVFKNMTTNQAAAGSVVDCIRQWNTTSFDKNIMQLQYQFDCSGWCSIQKIFYFSLNGKYGTESYSYMHDARRVVRSACHEKVKEWESFRYHSSILYSFAAIMWLSLLLSWLGYRKLRQSLEN